MKKRLVTYLLVSALAAAVFAGCSKKDAGDGADAAATGATAVAEEAAEIADAADTAAAEVADEAVALAGTNEAAAEVAVPEEEAVEAVEAAAEDEEVDKEEAEKEEDYLVVEPGTQYTIRFGGNIYSTPEEIAQNIMYYANPGDYINVVERLDNFWYKVTYYLSGEGVEHTGYIQIQ